MPTVALPCGSTSTSSVSKPASAMHAATLTAVVVLPTPPFWLAMAYTVLIRSPTLAARTADPAPLTRYRRAFNAGFSRTAAVSLQSRPGAGSRAAWARSCAHPQRAALGSRERHGPPAAPPPPARARRRSCAVGGFGLTDLALPSDDHAAVAQQRRGVLVHDRQRRQRPGSDDVARARCRRATPPRARTRRQRSRVPSPRPHSDERALAIERLHEHHARVREHRSEDQARQPAARAEIGDRPAQRATPGPPGR